MQKWKKRLLEFGNRQNTREDVNMDFFEVIKKRRSIRRFTADPVQADDLRIMLEAARLAPSPYNQQPWRFIVIRDKELKTKLKDVVLAIVDSQAEVSDHGGRGLASYDRRFNATNVFDAPIVVVALTHPWPSVDVTEQPNFNAGLQATAAAIAHLHLAAAALGYGGCWATLPLLLAQAEIEAVLEVKKPWFTAAVVSIGVPVRMPPEIPRKPIEELVTYR
ncbi:MAG: nitroreductase family protein [Dehalococcoidia bacterium]|nr:nitroreductase family protein [Dehalococcoidia bacterium]